ncbi:M61 family metallopeptidase [Terricaulis silvestris]|uniref:Peptidase M61 catalytic domain-containing protein n=1 Tax=Terricaulis silvestris TaxID=2686094 RepID=A0A6I6MV76_9CAUL|nr:hypothetical protein [Terricaulis silvestris]QGZ96667.1 hypothetical protein DSM104635_03528 [Terricaulis silvestris]
MKRFIAALAVLVCAAFAPAPRVEYTLSPVMRDGALTAVAVHFSFRGDADGETSIRLPDSWASESELWRGIEGLSASGAEIVETGDAGERVLRHRPNARVRISYRVIQDWDGEPTGIGGNPYRPIVRSTYYHLIGETALITPDLDAATRVSVRARGFPRGWSFASDLEHRGLTLEAVHQSVLVGGDYRVLTRGPMRVAIRGAWAFTDEALTDRIGAILAAQRAFWGDRDEPFLVTMTQLAQTAPGFRSLGGTGLADAFAFFATPNAEEAAIARTLAHEGQHTWVPRRIGGISEVDEASQYWLSEGFTDFYTGRVMVRSGLWTPQEFASDLNRMLRAYGGSPARTETNARINVDFWNDPDVRSLPYQRGRLLATIWDHRLRAAGGGRDFDDVVLEMKRRSMAGAMAREPQVYATDLFARVAPEMGLALGDDLQTYVEQGAAVLLPEDAFAPCGRVTTREVTRFHRGFDVEATTANNNVVTGLNPQSPAYAAGLRDGMAILRREAGEVGNADVEIVYIVRDGDAERTIRFMPRGTGSYTLQEFVLEAPLEGERLAQCRAVLGGG